MSAAVKATLSAADLAAKQEALALWEADRARLMLAQPFLALLAMQLELVPVVDPRLATAATDGERVFVCARFLLGLEREERLFVLAHEVWHCAALHFLRRGSREPQLWNLAVDHEVNALLQEQGMTVPEDAVLFPRLRGQNAETVYKWLQGKARRGRGRDRGRLADVHDYTPPAEAPPLDPDYTPQPNWRAWPARVVAAAQQVERQHGHLPAGVAQLVRSYREPQLCWRELLRSFVSQGLERRRRWMPPNRRFLSQGLYLPAQERVPCLELALAVDTSGSTREVLPEFLAELIGIAGAFGDYRLRLLMCDAAMHSDQVYSPYAPLQPEQVRFEGGGGTNFVPIFTRLAEGAPPRVLVCLTDGYGPAPSQAPNYPVLWVLTRDGQRPAPWGEVIWLR